ncbi:helix-turn-helix transcriptional regulator [Actinoallomurus sp. NPDC052274]|uniref:helix-turn-helix domain-containing protein n=1 Tax=Actinoallomurus sp. NPDC052274 TaxID=3155420 RepID=UPI0034284ACB
MSARQFLAREIRLARETKRISRAALGKALFVSGELVAAWETGRSIPRPEHLASMIGLLDFRPEIVSRLLDE